jgi:hypothetical protein
VNAHNREAATEFVIMKLQILRADIFPCRLFFYGHYSSGFSFRATFHSSEDKTGGALGCQSLKRFYTGLTSQDLVS